MPRKYTIVPHSDFGTFDISTSGQPYRGRLDWYDGENFYNYPNLFLKGFDHFRRVINVHNKRWPHQQWPYLTLREFLDRAKAIQVRRWRKKNWKPSKDTVKSIIDANRQKALKRKKQLFYNWLDMRYGAGFKPYTKQSFQEFRDWQERRLNARLKFAAKQGLKKNAGK